MADQSRIAAEVADAARDLKDAVKKGTLVAPGYSRVDGDLLKLCELVERLAEVTSVLAAAYAADHAYDGLRGPGGRG